MKFVPFLLAIFTFTTLNAKEILVKPFPPKNWKFTLGWYYSPEVSFRFLQKGSNADGITDLLIDKRNNVEKIKFGQSFSIFGGYQLSKTLTIEAGIGYTDFGEGIKPFDLFHPGEITPAYGQQSGSNHLHVASVPITLHAHFGKNRIKGFISAGISPGIMLRYTNFTKTTSYYSDFSMSSNSYSTSEQDFYSKFVLGAHVSGGIEYHYNSRGSLRIAPVFRITTNSVYSQKEIRGNYFNAGIQIGTVYRL